MFCAYLLSLFGTIAQGLAAYPTNQTFDYIIVGGGTAGLLLANKLSSDPQITVAIIEAGDAQYDNPIVTRLDTFFAGVLSPLDWAYTSASQKYILNKTFTYDAGKALGGTTTINGMAYLRAEKEQIDAWEELGNEGWDWDSLYQYYREQEHFQPPDNDIANNGATFEEGFHGFEGELAVGWSSFYMKQGIFDILKETSENMGLPWNKDANGGRMGGFSTLPSTINSSINIREDAARAYYYPIAEQRSNLHVFLNTTATRIAWDETTKHADAVRAKGVEVITSTNTTQSISASKEVILSAGSLRSPALLEHSGVGNPSILSPLGIDPVINLPSVGANLQDQPNNLISYTSTTNWTGYPSFVTYLTASDLFGPDLASITSALRANLTQYAARIVADAPANDTTLAIEEALLTLQTDLIFSPNSTVPLAEFSWFPLGNAILVAFWNLLPYSRGSVHITSANATVHPSINPNFLQLPIDAYVQAAAAVKVREYFATAPLAEHVTAEVQPGTSVVPPDAGWGDAAWEAWLKASWGVNNHPVSSCAMRSREWGGVVDAQGRLYGAGNVRVVDASVFPMQISGHLSASIYAIAGKIADAIMGGK